LKKISIVEVSVVVAVQDGQDPADVTAHVTKSAYAFKHELGEVAHFSVQTRDVSVQEQPQAQEQ